MHCMPGVGVLGVYRSPAPAPCLCPSPYPHTSIPPPTPPTPPYLCTCPQERKRRWLRQQGVGIGDEPGDDPPELALATAFVAKGLGDEAERALRFAINQRNVDEGGGIRILLKVKAP